MNRIFWEGEKPVMSQVFGHRLNKARGRGLTCLRILAFTAWAMCLTAAPPAQDAFSRFERITTRQGLAASQVLILFQDRHGFLWAGTEGGLCRYDGTTFVTYRSLRKDPSSLSENMVCSLLEDPAGDLWVGTYNGLNRLDVKTGRFQRFLHDSRNPRSLSQNTVFSICRDHAGTIWAGTKNGGLNRLDDSAGSFTRFRHDPANPGSLASDRVCMVMEDRQGRLWVATDGGGINRLDRATGAFTRFRHDPADSTSLPSDRVYTLHEDRRGRFWVGTIDRGLARFDPATGRFVRYPFQTGGAESLSDPYVRQIAEDRQGRLWIATYSGGLNCLDPVTGRYTVYRHHIEDPGSLSHFQVLSVLIDRSGMLWAGTFDGISKLDLAGKAFHKLRRVPGNPESLSDNSVSAVLEDRAGGIWIGTDRGGLNYRDPADGRFRCFLPDPKDPGSLVSECVTALLEDPDGTLWVGTYAGLCRLDPARRRFTRFASDPGRPGCLRGTLVMSLLRDRRGVLWVGTPAGLNRLNPDGRTFTTFLHRDGDPASLGNDYIFALCEDRQGRLWVGTNDGGISVMDPARLSFRHYRNDPREPRSLGSDVVFALHEDRQGILWAGTAGGLSRHDPASDDFTSFTTEDGLPNDSVLGILEDDRGGFWLSTLQGICRLDPRNRAVRAYDTRDGISGNDCFQGSVCQGHSGQFYIGSTGGLTIFRPEEIRDDAPHPPIVLTSLKVLNRDFPAGQAPADLHRLTVSHRQNSLSFEYTALEYRAPEKIRYAYRLENFDAGWVQAGSRRMAAYTNLDPGTYRFQVKAANSDGRWGRAGIDLRIEIPPPFWQTTWFRVLGLLAFIGLSNLLVFGARKGYRMAVYWRRSRFISHFRVMQKIGRGGMGTVYKVKDLNSGRTYALKVMNEELVAAASDRQRFVEESFICETLDHPNVVRVYEKGEVDNSLYYTMEYFDGQSIQELLQKSRPDVRTAVLLTRVLFDILHDIHQRGVIHRDIKPGNIMLARTVDFVHRSDAFTSPDVLRPAIRILDFGLARFLDSRTLTQTGSFVGSLQYMPPEFLRGARGRSPACDYYSLGVILYEMLTGRLPYAGTEICEMIFAMAGGSFPAPREIVPEVPPALSDFTVRLIHPDEARRVSDYEEIRTALAAMPV